MAKGRLHRLIDTKKPGETKRVTLRNGPSDGDSAIVPSSARRLFMCVPPAQVALRQVEVTSRTICYAQTLEKTDDGDEIWQLVV